MSRSQVDALKSVRELVIKKDASLLAVGTSTSPCLRTSRSLPRLLADRAVLDPQEFAPELAALQIDASALVRRYLAELLEEAAAAAPQPAVLQPVVLCLQALCSDGTASVAKRAVPAATAVFRTCFALVAAQATMLAFPQDSVSMTKAISAGTTLKCDCSPQPARNDPHAAKRRSVTASRTNERIQCRASTALSLLTHITRRALLITPTMRCIVIGLMARETLCALNGVTCLWSDLISGVVQGRMPGPPQSLTELWSTCTAMRTAVVGLLQPGSAY